MADHYLRAVEHLDEVDCHRQELTKAYQAQRLGRPPAGHVIPELHQQIGFSMKLAEIHAQLAEVQILRDVGSGKVLSS